MDTDKKMKRIEEAFSSYLMDHDDKYFSREVSAILNSMTNSKKKFVISVINSNNRPKEPFFGMRVFPAEEQIDVLLKNAISNESDLATICKRWSVIFHWVIEIDDRVFDRDQILFNPQELTAMLLHEIGHTVYSDKKIEMFYRAYKECSYKLKTTELVSAKIMYSLYMIPLTIACGIRNWSITDRDLREEIFADQSVQKLGYGEHLISAYSKIIKTYGSTGFNSEDLERKQIESSVEFCNVNVSDLRHRRDKLKDELYRTGASTNSNYIRNIISTIMKKLGVADKYKYDGNIALEADFNGIFDNEDYLKTNTLVFDMKTFNALESSIRALQRVEEQKLMVAAEGFLRKSKSKEIPSQLDVDNISVEVDRISNHADRRYVLDLIYYQEDKIEKFLETCEYNKELKKKYADKMHRMLDELQACRNAVLAKKSFDKKYKVFVSYPAGYEG